MAAVAPPGGPSAASLRRFFEPRPCPCWSSAISRTILEGGPFFPFRGPDLPLRRSSAWVLGALPLPHRDARAAGLGEADGDRLLGILGAVLSLADVADLFVNEFTRGAGRRLPALQFAARMLGQLRLQLVAW